jgi:hypothetical protein
VDKENVKAILRYAGAPKNDPVTSALVVVPADSGPGPLQEFELQVRRVFLVSFNLNNAVDFG